MRDGVQLSVWWAGANIVTVAHENYVIKDARNEECGRKPCTKRSPGLPEIEKRRKISKYWSIAPIAVRDGGVENPPRYAMLGKYLRFLRKSWRYAKPFWAPRRVNMCAYDIGSSKSPLTSETSPLCFRNRFSDIRHEVTRGGGVTGWYQSRRDFYCTAMADQAEQYVYQRFPYLRLDDTPSSSTGADSDPSDASSAASQATPAGPHTPSSLRPVTPPPPPSPVPPPASPVITTDAGTSLQDHGATPRHQMAPRDEPQAIQEVGESSHQSEWRAQLQQVTQDLQGMRQDIQQQNAMIDDTRSTILEILTSHLTIIDRVNTLEVDTQAWRTSVEERLRRTWVRRIIATFWQQVELLRTGVVRVREFLIWLGMASFETKMIVLGLIMAAVAMVFSCLSYFLR
ncbi:hypothetical protein E3N88_10170 [Mikania micrantha]|uniref:Uncharacterized protein n=1 Tax=Mikania micrantha TaxID=192012 RepID=A0A5N6PB19_9ASTR|nr:hypothetical protein E3N88_10170 [Mikania micrantha]